MNCADEKLIDKINTWCHENDPERHQTLHKIATDNAGGTKLFTGYIYAAAFNHFPHEELILFFETMKGWEYPEEAVMLVNYEGKHASVHFPELGN